MQKSFRLAVVNSHPIQYFAPLYKEIAQTSDIDITVFYCSRQGLEKGFVDPGFGKEVVWDVPLLEGYAHEFLSNLGGDRGVRGFFSLVNPSVMLRIWRGKFDAVLIHGHSSITNLMALAAARLAGTRVFMRGETHLSLSRGLVKRALRRPVMSLFYRLCSACLYIGSANRDFYLAHGVPRRKLFFVPYTVDNDAFAARTLNSRPNVDVLRRKLGIAVDLPVVLYASKLTRRKRPRDVLLAHAMLRGCGVQSALVIVGDGEQRASLETEAHALGLRDVAFAGFVNQNELPAYFALSSAFVLPSENEPWGLIINEAMSCGLPVVTTDAVGAARDLVRDGVTGYTYPVGDIPALADALARVLDRAQHPAGMREACLDRMSRWSYEQDIEGIRNALAQNAESPDLVAS
jgi:glycosyltransferase involved in cell wall biosynthesis